MTDEERKALVERLREDDTDPKMLNQAADQIEADGKRIAELEAKVNALVKALNAMLNLCAEQSSADDLLDSHSAGMAYAALALVGGVSS